MQDAPDLRPPLHSALEPPEVVHGDHVVQFYERDADLIDSVGAYLIDAARDGAVSVVVATDAHRYAFARHLGVFGIDVAAAQRDGSLVLLDAADTLARFARDGVIDRFAFFDVIGGTIRDAVATGRPVRAYGEMVALLWDAGHVLAAIDLEALWNELAGELPFSLYCAYNSASVEGHEHADALHEVCRLHAAVVPGPDRPADVTAEFSDEPMAAVQARRLVAGAVRRWGHELSLVADAELVASELAVNAILHAQTPFRVSVQRHGPMVRIAVHDRAASQVPQVRAPDAGRTSGRGMYLVRAIARRWGVEVTADGKTVWAELGA